MGAEVYPVPPEVLDAPSWLLKMHFDA
jgi:hypothetical protein